MKVWWRLVEAPVLHYPFITSRDVAPLRRVQLLLRVSEEGLQVLFIVHCTVVIISLIREIVIKYCGYFVESNNPKWIR